MEDFPAFMKTPENSIASKSQSRDVKGWVYDGVDGKQMAYWVCETNGVSNGHVHDFDEYFVVLQGRFTLIINDQKLDFHRGDEYVIPRNVPHAGEFVAGTRTIHCFGGKRAERG